MSQQINLFNPVFLKQRKIFTARAMGQALAVLVTGIAVLSMYSRSTLAELESQSESSARQLERRQAKLAELTAQFAPRTSSAELAAQVTYMEAQVKALKEVSSVLDRGAFGNTHGYTGYFRAFAHQDAPGVWLTGLQIEGAGNDITIDGRALGAELVPSYIRSLSGQRALQGKTFGSLEITTPAVEAVQGAVAAVQPAAAKAPVPYVEFQLKAEPVEQQP